MEGNWLRYGALGAGTLITGLLIIKEQLPEEVLLPILVAIFGIAGADMIKHRAQ